MALTAWNGSTGRPLSGAARGDRPAAARLLLLGSGLDNASWRFRMAQYVPGLRARGLAVETADLHRRWPARLRLLAGAAHYDAVCVHRALLNPVELLCLRRAAPRYVFDFDDAIMFHDSAHPPFASRRRSRRVARMLRGAGAVIAGNAYLADWARRYQPAVAHIPTAVDLAPYDVPSPLAGEGQNGGSVQPAATIGWIGTRINLMYLRTIIPALARLAAREPHPSVTVVCDGALEALGLPVINKRWSLEAEVDDLRRFDVGIMPLPDDPWTRGKCAVKILQYFAAGLPVVCSPVGANRDIVEHGRNGYFASTEDEWVARLGELLADADLRRRFGAHGRALVERRYSIAATLPLLIDVLLS